jgi:predicted membrane chloride channel (bestrophin family)
MLSIAIIFPLVFAIRGSFRRREKALEHLSQFRGALKTLYYFIQCDSMLTEENKKNINAVLLSISEETLAHLEENSENTHNLDQVIDKVHLFILSNTENINTKLRDRLLRFMNDLHEALENLIAIKVHRTPLSLKAYCKIFIYLFPIVYAPTIISHVGMVVHPAFTYFIVILTQFILITLYNIQDQLEYPFDNHGPDDIKLGVFKINR